MPDSSPAPRPYAVLASLAAVQDLIKSAPSLLCLYIHASWQVAHLCCLCFYLRVLIECVDECSTESHPLYANACRRWADAQIQFTAFDCAPEQQMSKEEFNLTFIPCWKLYQHGRLIATIDGDWTQFEPLLTSLVGPPQTTVAVTPAEAKTLAVARLSFQELAVKLARRDARKAARRNGTRGPDEPDTESDSSAGSETDSEAE